MENLFSMVVLAGGLATRLYPITHKIPKSMVLIHGEPFIAHQLRLFKKKGFKKIVLCIGHLGFQIKEYVESGSQFGLSVSYSEEGDHLLGTAGALKKALPLLEDNFFVIYGDSFLDCDYSAIQHAFLKGKHLSLMTIFKNNDKGDKSNIEFKNGKIIKYDKEINNPDMEYIDYGLSLFNKSIFFNISENTFCDLAYLYKRLLMNQQLSSFEVYQPFFEVGSKEGIVDLKNHLQHFYCI